MESNAKQEPVAWKHDCAALLTNDVELWIDACPHCGKPRPAPQPKPAEQEAVLYVHPATYAMEHANQIGVWRPGCQLDDYLPLYFAPQPRKRLTDEELGKIINANWGVGVWQMGRAIEDAIWSKT